MALRNVMMYCTVVCSWPSHAHLHGVKNSVNDLLDVLLASPSPIYHTQLICPLCRWLTGHSIPHKNGFHYISGTPCSIQDYINEGIKVASWCTNCGISKVRKWSSNTFPSILAFGLNNQHID